ncbi:MAG: YlxR family protein [Friedmanniella sp.]
MASPRRRCVGCRSTAEKSELVRLVWQGEVVIDSRQREPGRGAYLHPGPSCLAQAVRRRAIGRALRIPGFDSEALTRRWAEQDHVRPA